MLNTLKTLPKSAGVYQYFDANNRLLYVGKAKNLFNRVRSYFNFTPTLRPKSTLSSRIITMLNQTVRIEYIVVATEHDALILENSLIKQLRPKYNILMRDDKTYPYIVIDTKAHFPRLEFTRTVKNDKSLRYFGPFSTGARDILSAIYEVVPLIQKSSCLKEKKACLYYQIKKCKAPCEGKITPQEYANYVNQAMQLVFNKQKLIDTVTARMHTLAESLRFEEAQVCKEQIQSIEKSTISTPIDLAKDHFYDIFAIAHNQEHATVSRMFMREGKIVSSSTSILKSSNGFDIHELYTRAIVDFYTTHETLIAAHILVAHDFEERENIAQLLTQKANKKITIAAPQKGEKLRIVTLAHDNALHTLANQSQKHKTHDTTLKQIAQLFKLNAIPQRIEAFDNSHLQGVGKVGAMVVYDTYSFDKKSYRHYHLDAFDEYHQMKQMLLKRIERFSTHPAPDLWVIDGGSTLLNLALTLLKEHGITLDVIAIAKEKIDAKAHRAKGKANDIIWTKDEAFKLPHSDNRLHFLQRMRDEAHRFAIGFHKKVKQKHDQDSALLSVKGVGPATIKRLLNHYGSFENIKNASLESLSQIVSPKLAKTIKSAYV